MSDALAPVGLRLARVERELLTESAKARTAAMVAAQRKHDALVRQVLDDARDRAGLVSGAEYSFSFADDFSAITFTPTGAQAKAPEPAPESADVLPVPPSLKGAARARAHALDDSFTPSPPPAGGPT